MTFCLTMKVADGVGIAEAWVEDVLAKLPGEVLPLPETGEGSSP